MNSPLLPKVSSTFKNKSFVYSILLGIFLLCFGLADIAVAQNTLNNVGLTSATPAAAAYSTRKLSTSYAGFALKVRRASDNAEANVAFDGSGTVSASSVLTVTVAGTGLAVNATLSFSSFYASTNCFVTTWYDQSGNARNAT